MTIKFKSKLGSKSSSGSEKKSGILGKFKKKSDSTLEKLYREREEKSKMVSGGRSILNQELMQELDLIEIFPQAKTRKGDNFFEILPASYGDEPYCKEVPIHNYVGMNGDSYLCLVRYNKGKCYRCKIQREMYKQSDGVTTDYIKKLFPQDRVLYLVWDRTDELANDKAPKYQLGILNAPKNKFHSEIQEKVRDKISKKNLDISDPNPGGDGRTLYYKMEIEKSTEGNFPKYFGFDLIPRPEEGLPNEIMEKLDAILSYADEHGETIFDLLLNLHEDEELEEAMKTEISSSSKKSTGGKKFGNKNQEELPEDEQNSEEGEEEIDLDEIENELSSKNMFQIRMWTQKHKIKHVIEGITDPQEAVQRIVDYYVEMAENQ